jgi:hypothetical protein
MTVDRWQSSNKAYLFNIHNSILLALANTEMQTPPCQLNFIPLQHLDASEIKFKSYKEHHTM